MHVGRLQIVFQSFFDTQNNGIRFGRLVPLAAGHRECGCEHGNVLVHQVLERLRLPTTKRQDHSALNVQLDDLLAQAYLGNDARAV
jgi:hypothetical protein